MIPAPTWQTELGAAIKAARKAAEISQKDLAVALGVRQSSVSQWERGTTAPRTEHLLGLLRVLGPRLARFLGQDTAVTERGGAHDTTQIEYARSCAAPLVGDEALRDR